jgi:hypothetical protein
MYCDVLVQLLIRYSTFVGYWRKKWEYYGTVYQLFIVSRRHMTQSGKKYCKIF